MLRDSNDQMVRQADITIQTGRKWSASRAAVETEARLRHKDIVGTINQGRLGLGVITRARWKNASAKGRCNPGRAVHGGGRGQTSQGSVHETSKEVDTLAWCSRKTAGLEGYMAHGEKLNQIPSMLYIQCLTNTSKVALLGAGRDPKLHAVWETGKPGTRAVILPCKSC